MILFIGSVMAVDRYCRKYEISPAHRRILTRFDDLKGYNPEKLPEIICIGDWYKSRANSDIREHAEHLGYKIRIIM